MFFLQNIFIPFCSTYHTTIFGECMEELNISIGKKIHKLRKEKGFSLSKLAEIAGISKEEMMKVLSRKGIPINYDIEDLKEDIKRLECLL